MTTLKLTTKDFDASMRYIANDGVLDHDGDIEIEASLGCVTFQRHKESNIIQCDYCGQQETFETVTKVEKPWTKGYFPFKRGWIEWLFPLGLLAFLALAASLTIIIHWMLHDN